MNTNELHPLAAEVATQLAGHPGSFMMLVSCETHPGRADDLIQAFQVPLQKTVLEEGNETYRLAQDRNDPEQFLVIESWRDLEALDAHLKQPYLTNLLADLEPILAAAPSVRVLLEPPTAAQDQS